MKSVTLVLLCLFASLSFTTEANDGKRKPPVNTSTYDTIVKILFSTDTENKK